MSGELYCVDYLNGSVIEKYANNQRVRGFDLFKDKLIIMNMMGQFFFHTPGVLEPGFKADHPKDLRISVVLTKKYTLSCYNMVLLRNSLLTFIKSDADNTVGNHMICHISFKEGELCLDTTLLIPVAERDSSLYFSAQRLTIQGIEHLVVYSTKHCDDINLICIHNSKLHMIKIFKASGWCTSNNQKLDFSFCGVTRDNKLLISSEDVSDIRSIEFLA